VRVRARDIAGALIAALALATPPAVANDEATGGSEVSEQELRELETEMLGPEHAAEHALQRALARERSAAPSSTSAVAVAAEEHARAAAAGPPEQVGRWSAPFSIPIFGIHAVMLPTGKVMWWSYPDPFGPDRRNTAQAWLWDLRSGSFKRIDPPLWLDPADGQLKPANIWCSGNSLLADGRVLVAGGNLDYALGPGSAAGLNKVYTFDPFTESWTEQPDMPHGRWYPTQVLQPDGRTVIMSGLDESGADVAQTNKDVELFTPSAGRNGRGTVTRLAIRGPGGPPDGGLYPHTFLMPSGRTLVAGPYPSDSWLFDRIGPANAFLWADLPDLAQPRYWGTAVLAPGGPRGSGRVSLIGGSPYAPPFPDPIPGPLPTTETLDERTLRWGAGPSMNIGRSHHNTVLLPDGSMVTVGGGYGTRPPDSLWAFDPPQQQIEIYDPKTASWRLGPAQAEGRAYHSTAILLPDGRVVSAGDEMNGGLDRDTAEIYEPPYLFRKGSRPRIRRAPRKTTWKDKFGIKTASKNVKRAVLMAPSATTHANDMNQRHVELKVLDRVQGAGIDVKAPRNRAVAPPGFYMLFLLNRRGEPSIARWVRLVGKKKAPETGLIASKPRRGRR
jgi:Domain of unknown function (DUF1929)